MVEKLKLKTKRQFNFAISLTPENVPPLSARLAVAFESFPDVTTKNFQITVGINGKAARDSKIKPIECYKAVKLLASKYCRLMAAFT